MFKTTLASGCRRLQGIRNGPVFGGIEFLRSTGGARWLSDNRRLLVGYQGRLYLINSVSAKIHEVLSVLPDDILGYSLSRDDRLIVYALRSNRADIWLASPESRTPERQQ